MFCLLIFCIEFDKKKTGFTALCLSAPYPPSYGRVGQSVAVITMLYVICSESVMF